MKKLMLSVAFCSLLTTASMAETALEQLKDPRSPDGLNMGAVEMRQKEMRSKGVSNDVSMKILGVAQQRAMETKLVEQKAQLMNNMPKKKGEQAAVAAKIAQLDANIKALQDTITGQLRDIQKTLGLTPEQLANIKGVDHQQKMRDTARSSSDPRIGKTMKPELPPRAHEAPPALPPR